ncbi:MAG: putative ABC transporter permease [Desulfocucumaceae bacterium]
MKIARFIIYGLMGWGLEIIWTGLGSAIRGDVRLTGSTYLWMFPIYGLGFFLEPAHDSIRSWPWFYRGLFWVLAIWIIEYSTGGAIRLLAGESPWDYTGSTRWQVNGLIRLDMAPLWFTMGLLFERAHDLLVSLTQRIKR